MFSGQAPSIAYLHTYMETRQVTWKLSVRHWLVRKMAASRRAWRGMAGQRRGKVKRPKKAIESAGITYGSASIGRVQQEMLLDHTGRARNNPWVSKCPASLPAMNPRHAANIFVGQTM